MNNCNIYSENRIFLEWRWKPNVVTHSSPEQTSSKVLSTGFRSLGISVPKLRTEIQLMSKSMILSTNWWNIFIPNT